jgi:glutathione S-transferase
MADQPSVKLYSAWFCPFAQRTWITLLEKGVNFELVEIDPYNKTPEFLAVNPRGLVPALIHNEKSIYESLVIDEYIDEAWPMEPRLMPQDPYDRAQARIWIDFIGKKIVPQFYHILQQQDAEKQSEAKASFLDALKQFSDAMTPGGGPFFFGENFTLVDIAMLPFALRLPILTHYRDFGLPHDGSFDRFKTWLKACQSRQSVTPTEPPADKLIAIYQRYADNTANSQVAEAIRKGAALP